MHRTDLNLMPQIDWGKIEQELPSYRRHRLLRYRCMAVLAPPIIALALALFVGFLGGDGPFRSLNRFVWRYSPGQRLFIVIGILFGLGPVLGIPFLRMRIQKTQDPHQKMLALRDIHDYLKVGEYIVYQTHGLQFSTTPVIGSKTERATLLDRKYQGSYTGTLSWAFFSSIILLYGALSMGGVRGCNNLSYGGQMGMTIAGSISFGITLGVLATIAMNRKTLLPPPPPLPFSPDVELANENTFALSFARALSHEDEGIAYLRSENLKICDFSEGNWEKIYEAMEAFSDEGYCDALLALKNNVSFNWERAIRAAHRSGKLHLMREVIQKSQEKILEISDAIGKILKDRVSEVRWPMTEIQSLRSKLGPICEDLRLPYVQVIRELPCSENQVLDTPGALPSILENVLLSYVLPSIKN